jgi:hypothetical protein
MSEIISVGLRGTGISVDPTMCQLPLSASDED